jgi:hypothetical protein
MSIDNRYHDESPKEGGYELWSYDENGKKIDAHLHDPMINGISDGAHDKLLEWSRERARRRGLPEHLVRQFYPTRAEAREMARKKGWSEESIKKHYGPFD